MKVKHLIKILEDFSPEAEVTIYNPGNPMKPIDVVRVLQEHRIFAHEEDEDTEIAILKTF